MRLGIVILIVVFAGLTGSAHAQSPARPDLAGHWILDAQLVPIDGRVPICAAECTLSQAAGSLTVSEGMHARTYQMDGVPALSIASTTEITAKISTIAAWEAATLVIAETIDSAQLNGGKPFTTTARMSLSEGRLVIEGVRSTNAGAADKFRVIYRKGS